MDSLFIIPFLNKGVKMFIEKTLKQKLLDEKHRRRKKLFEKRNKLLNIQKDTDYSKIFGICNNLDCSIIFKVDEKRLKYLKIKEYKNNLIKHNKIKLPIQIIYR